MCRFSGGPNQITRQAAEALRPGAGPAAPILPLCPGLPEKMIDVSDAIRRRRELSISRIRLDVLIWRCCQFDLESARRWDDVWATSVPRLSNQFTVAGTYLKRRSST